MQFHHVKKAHVLLTAAIRARCLFL